MTGQSKRVGSIAVALLLMAAAAAIGCGESDEEKAQNQVCDARADIEKRVNSLADLTLSTATVGRMQDDLEGIQDDVEKIADAQADLSDERRQEVESANKEFSAHVESIASDLRRDLSLSGAEAKLRNAAQQLAASYRQTFKKVDCE
jgi:Asp-tRNA(Asn)/Glu-tRNA(Gln) amidotransferase C subunit